MIKKYPKVIPQLGYLLGNRKYFPCAFTKIKIKKNISNRLYKLLTLRIDKLN